MKTRLTLVAAVLFLAGVGTARLQAAFPKPTGYVNDFANILDAPSRAELDALLRDAEQKTSAEIVIATVPSLDGMSVEEYANKMFAEWGVGKKKEDNGILVVVASSDRSMRIEVGYGLEPVLPDGLAGEIIRAEFLPRFRENDYPGGIRNGMRRLVSVVEAHHVLTPEERQRLTESSGDEPPLWILIPFFGLFITIGSLAIGVGLRAKAVGPLLFGGLFAGLPLLISLALAFFATAVILGPLAIGMMAWGFRLGARASWREGARGTGRRGSGSGWVMGGSGSGSGSSGSSSSGSSGGSFGGGSSGGGGASGKW